MDPDHAQESDDRNAALEARLQVEAAENRAAAIAYPQPEWFTKALEDPDATWAGQLED